MNIAFITVCTPSGLSLFLSRRMLTPIYIIIEWWTSWIYRTFFIPSRLLPSSITILVWISSTAGLPISTAASASTSASTSTLASTSTFTIAISTTWPSTRCPFSTPRPTSTPLPSSSVSGPTTASISFFGVLNNKNRERFVKGVVEEACIHYNYDRIV